MVRSVRPHCGAKVAAHSFGVCQPMLELGAVDVVVRAPVGQRGAGMGQRRDQGFVQQLIAQPPVEAFDEGVLRRLARRDVVPVDLAFVGEGESRVRGELGAVIRDDLDCTGFVPVRCSC